jgi:hypothetical protein
MTIQSSGFGFQPEVLVKALQQTHTLIEVPMDLMEREHGDSKAFRWKNAVDVYHTLRRLRAITRLSQDYEGRPAGAQEPR